MAPRAKTQFDSLIGSVAKEGTKLAANKNSGYPSNYIKSKWKSYIKTVVMPDLQKPQYKALATELREYPADFLYTLAG
jgi:ribonuclease HII